MAKKSKAKTETSTEIEVSSNETSKEEVVVEEVKPLPMEKLLISFNSYFSSLNRPEKHKSGRAAYTDTRIRRTKEDWDRIFKDY